MVCFKYQQKNQIQTFKNIRWFNLVHVQNMQNRHVARVWPFKNFKMLLVKTRDEKFKVDYDENYENNMDD